MEEETDVCVLCYEWATDLTLPPARCKCKWKMHADCLAKWIKAPNGGHCVMCHVPLRGVDDCDSKHLVWLSLFAVFMILISVVLAMTGRQHQLSACPSHGQCRIPDVTILFMGLNITTPRFEMDSDRNHEFRRSEVIEMNTSEMYIPFGPESVGPMHWIVSNGSCAGSVCVTGS